MIGLRCVFLIFIGVILYTYRDAEGRAYVVTNLAIALGAGAVATIVYAVFAFVPSLSKSAPIALMVGDWVMAAAMVYASEADIYPLMAITGVLIVSGALRIGVMWGAIQSVGVIAASIAALAALFGVQQLASILPQLTVPLLTTVLVAVVANVWGFILQREIKVQGEEIADVHESQTTQIANLRERTRAIYEMSATLSKTLNYEKILMAALNAGAIGLREQERRGKENLVSVAMLVRAKDNALYVVTGRGLPFQDEHRVIPGRSGIIAQAFAQAVPMIGGSARKDPELQAFAAFQDMRSTLVIPLRAGWDNFGILLYGSDRADAFSDEHTDLLKTIAIQATVALQNAALYHNLQEERDRIVEVEEDARKKLARDLHDGPTQNVAAIAMRMGIIQKMLERTPDDVPSELKKVEDLARRTTKEIRHMLFTLRPLVLENQGLAAALEQLAEKMKETHNQNVSVRVARDAERVLDAHHQGVIFYIIEEAVGNARKHAEAEVINVTLHRQEDIVVVRIADNGKGFDPKAVMGNYDKRGSLGMINLQERTQLLGGTLNLESAPGRGTTITVLVPVKETPIPDQDTKNRRPTGTTPKLAVSAMDRIREAES